MIFTPSTTRISIMLTFQNVAHILFRFIRSPRKRNFMHMDSKLLNHIQPIVCCNFSAFYCETQAIRLKNICGFNDIMADFLSILFFFTYIALLNSMLFLQIFSTKLYV